MREWKTLTPTEKETARAGRGHFACKEKMDTCLRDTLALLTGNAAATEMAWSITWGDYLVNSPEEIADYCKNEAARETGEDAEGICPVCGAELEYTGDTIPTCGGGMHPWKCPACGATGEEGFNEVFDGHHYNVQDKDGNPVEGGAESV